MKSQVVATLMLLPTLVFAQEVYKSVDAQGRVTYSTTPPADSVSSESVKVQAGPGEEEREAAQQRLQSQQGYLQQKSDARAQRDQERQQQEASRQPVTVTVPSSSEVSEGWYPAYPGNVRPPVVPPPLEYPGSGDHPSYRPRPQPPASLPAQLPRPRPR